ncbi:spexin prohormone 1 isoform X2 [Callorhinchus milii]|uniref:Spexin n=1 Tax=Callorhinchus milii TaxID=7868 RepID=A0A4W3J8C2_CALMI|nr:spexin prohormone 1 isoform X2 [Callorhinchus milii]|eukprot:gi/632959182/ref/XP_007895473.1/ PREDICTED: spexin isoform X2 [Callorhinchus milii]
MKGWVSLTVYALLLLLMLSFFVESRHLPQDQVQRRNWTPQAMLYLKGAQGRRLIAENGKAGALYETLETRSENSNPLTLSQATAMVMNLIGQAQDKYVWQLSCRFKYYCTSRRYG